jgi:hypothetical protein
MRINNDVDVEERKRMMEAITWLLADPRRWDEFDEYYSHLTTADKGVYDIGWLFWVCLDPEYPSNRDSLSGCASLRAILFLLSVQEYRHNLRSRTRLRATCETDTYWPFPSNEAYEAERAKNGNLADRLLLKALGREMY